MNAAFSVALWFSAAFRAGKNHGGGTASQMTIRHRLFQNSARTYRQLSEQAGPLGA